MQNWKGKGGLISKIRHDLGYSRTTNIKIEKVLVQIVLCEREGRKFNPADLDGRGGNRSPMFETDSIDANIIANNIESGLSERNTLGILNQHLTSDGREPATRASIVSVIRRLKPKIVKVEKQKQGSSDETSLWARARYMQTRQFLVRLGEIDDTTGFVGPVEKRWDRDTLGHLSLDQIAWWDETHRKCLIGGIENSF